MYVFTEIPCPSLLTLSCIDTPAQLKKGLGNILALQGQIESIKSEVNKVRSALRYTTSPAALRIIQEMEEHHNVLRDHVDALYGTLNVSNKFPDIKGASIEFLQTLFLARDLKVDIRKRVVGSFYEWDRLDQAVGGKANPLGTQLAPIPIFQVLTLLIEGTKLHQHTRKAISKWQPALLSAIHQYNKFCMTLKEKHSSTCKIPIPKPLPTSLQELRSEASHIMEDVIVTPASSRSAIQWLEDINVRKAIRAMLKRKRCIEERRRLGNEADNLCRWFGRRLAAVELAIRKTECESFIS
jgi:hypothetical protein